MNCVLPESYSLSSQPPPVETADSQPAMDAPPHLIQSRPVDIREIHTSSARGKLQILTSHACHMHILCVHVQIKLMYTHVHVHAYAYWYA